MLIAQITDLHIVERGQLLSGRVDSAAGLAAAIEHLNGLEPRPDLVVATGDLVNDGLDEQYDHLRELLEPLELPLLLLPGNHDDRAAMRRAFPDLPPPSTDHDRLDMVVDGHPLRIVALDTLVPGEHGGQLLSEQMAWLDGVLAARPDEPTVVFQHHPPFVTGIGWMDEVGLAGADLEADVLQRHSHVHAVLCGHVHRPIHARFGGTVASCWPSTAAQVALALDGTANTYTDEPTAVALHRWDPANGLVSHLSPVTAPTTWLPDWAQEL